MTETERKRETDSTDWKAIALELGQRVNFAIKYCECKGGALMDMEAGTLKDWRSYMAEALERIPGVSVDREILNTLSLPKQKQKAALAAIRAKRAEAAVHEPVNQQLLEALKAVLSWIDDWAETSEETGFEEIEAQADAAIALAEAAPQPAAVQEPVATIYEDGYWTRANNPTGKAVSEAMNSGKMMRLEVYAVPQPAAGNARDSARLDWLDGNLKMKMGWRVGVAPAGNISIGSFLGGNPTSIRAAIDAARTNNDSLA